MPIFGSLIKKMVFARFCHALSNLLSAGVPLIRALELTEGATGNSVVTKVIVGARESVRDGLDLAGPLAERQIFPPLITKMIAVGEETGALDQLLEKIAQFYEQEVQTGISRLTSLLEPVLVVTMGVVVGFIVISILLPVLSALSGPPM
jgi:type IV pilus assembly protein PilC